MADKQVEYEALSLLEEHEENKNSGRSARTSRVEGKGSTLTGLALLVFLFLDILLLLVIIKLILAVKSSTSNANSFGFRNPYIGLDKLYGTGLINTSIHGKIINEPSLATQVSSTDVNKVFPVDLHQWLSDFGRLSPPDRRFYVSKDVHTVVQFNVLDYGMENCSISVRLPSRGDQLPHPYTLPRHASTVRLAYCELESEQPLKERTLSWNRRPACSQKRGVIDALVGGEIELKPFECKSGSYLSYLVSCADESSECNLDVWTNHDQTWGLFLNQYQTV
ncbi:hypothetical protein CPB83DRAFT_358919 [Crepidotus variabilis]|uniref:Ubiquitin 3 binding protein But2 C-terminal domain-containing protein n=1 Tax=Crepidotus variabilis TaxID=179855 RepID=A0A9P6JP56_9AGAR|nr:hypothetical protein CPB83DRAFT_358919 [Crepidotus variabilis]